MQYLKTVLMLSLLTLTLLLSGCSPKAQVYSTDDVQTLMDAGVFDGEMAQVEGSIVALLYGIDADTVEECISYQAINSAISADEVTILILTDEGAAQAAETACQERVKSQIKTCQSYCPSAVPNLEAAVIDRVDNTVLLAVGNPNILPSAVNNLHK